MRQYSSREGHKTMNSPLDVIIFYRYHFSLVQCICYVLFDVNVTSNGLAKYMYFQKFLWKYSAVANYFKKKSVISE